MKEVQQLKHESWEVFNASYHEGGIIRQSMHEQGRAMLSEAEKREHEQRKDSLYTKLDAQNQLIERELRLRQLRAELQAAGGFPQ